MKDSFYVNLEHCPICGSKDYEKKHVLLHTSNKVIQKLKIYEVNTFLYKCRKCDFYFASPQISSELMSQYYKILDSEYYDNNNLNNNLNKQRPNSISMVLSILRKYKLKGKVLEIGCGKGYLLNELKKEGIYECFGIEPSPTASKFAMENFGLNIKNELFNGKSAFTFLFDVVILVDVIEHLNNPREVFNNIRRVLKPGGIVIVSTGNINSLNYKLFGKYWGYFRSWEHISFFNKNSINKLCKLTNFEIIEIKKFSYNGSLFKNIITIVVNFLLLGKNILKYFLNHFFHKSFSYSLVRLAHDHFVAVIKKN